MQVAENQDGEVKRGTPREYALPHGMEEVVGSIPTRSTSFPDDVRLRSPKRKDVCCMIRRHEKSCDPGLCTPYERSHFRTANGCGAAGCLEAEC